MPPTSSIRTATNHPAFSHHPDATAAATRRTTSGRAVRANTTRPTNYYARPFASAQHGPNTDQQDDGPIEYFPAITFFTDAITALPKEVQRQFTLMKEVEAKIYGNHEKLAEAIDELMTLPVPPRGPSHQLHNGAEAGSADAVGQGMLSLTANNSVFGSTAPSLINGVASNAPANFSAQNSVAGSLTGEDGSGNDEEKAKREKYNEMRMLISNMLPNLDEKGVVLAEANRILSRQHFRIDSVKPFLEEEISEEARLGSMTHWAYSDNRQRKTAAAAAATRRDVAATNNLAAAANAIHESEIAATRGAASREGREKYKGRGREQLDSDFDDRPVKKAYTKGTKKQLAAPASGLGISANGEPVKKRKIDKGAGGAGMERTFSTKGAKAAALKEARSTPGAEPVKKAKTKPGPLPSKRKGLISASPALASSPLHSSFPASGMEPPGSRPQSGRMRQSSNATNLRHEKLAKDDGGRPVSASGKSNGDRKRKAVPENLEEAEAKKTTEPSDAIAQDVDGQRRVHASHSGSNSGKAGRGSGAGTPRNENFPDGTGPVGLLRSRSTRSLRGNVDEDSSAEPGMQGPGPRMHKRQQSNSHLVKQLASFNRSPDIDRDIDDELDDDGDSGAERRRAERKRREAEGESISPKKRRPASRRNTLQKGASGEETASPAIGRLGDEDGDVMMAELPSEADFARNDRPPTRDARGDPPTAPSSPPAHDDAEMDDRDVEAYVEVQNDQNDREVIRDDPDATLEDLSDAGQEPEANVSDVEDRAPSLERHSDLADDEEVDDEVEEDEEEEDDEEGDPDDPNEPKYCYCNRGSYGEMIACDNEDCPMEWFHLGCTGLREPPEEEEKWFCRDCAPQFEPAVGSGRGRGRGGGRGRGRG